MQLRKHVTDRIHTHADSFKVLRWLGDGGINAQTSTEGGEKKTFSKQNQMQTTQNGEYL